jgi:Zn finger protein HypA/HybF involved in hydrogenase expression
LLPLTLGIEKIDACLNHCILYHKEHNIELRCPTCNTYRYKINCDNANDRHLHN